ncbi:MAG: hypothetical protein NXI24_00025 [bacterium]|nr:hypothetical protein [bacterium]
MIELIYSISGRRSITKAANVIASAIAVGLLVLLSGACQQFPGDCSDKDPQCDIFRLWYAAQSVTPVIVVGDSLGQIHVSYDGRSWQTIVVDSGFQLTDIIWQNDRFWLTSNNTIQPPRVFFSGDALTWNSTASGFTTGGRFSGIAFGNGRFVVTGIYLPSPQIYSSADGFTWSAVSDADLGTSDFDASPDANLLSFAGGQFIAGDVAAGIVFFSSDGLDWTVGLSSTSNPSQFSKTGDYFFWTDAGLLLAKTTLTGATPSAVSGPTGMRATDANNHGFGIAVGDASAIHTSEDGINWSFNRNPGGSVQMTTATVDDPRLMFAGGVGGVYYISTSGGETWEGPFTIPGAGNLRSAVTRPGFPFQ